MTEADMRDGGAATGTDTGADAAGAAAEPGLGPGRRYAHVIRLRASHAEEYLRLHREAWPEVLATITACNIRNYSIYLYGDLLFSYYEYFGSDYAADMARMAADPVTQRWWELTDPCQEKVPEAKPGEWWAALPEVFHRD